MCNNVSTPTILPSTRTMGLLALLVTLACAHLGCNVKSRSFTFSKTTGAGKSTTIRGSGDEQIVEVKLQDGGTITEFHSQGRIVLANEDKDVADIRPKGHLRIREETSSGTREIELEHDGSGEQMRLYRVDGSSADFDEDGRRWYMEMLDKMVRQSPIGAAVRAKRLFDQEGPRRLLNEVEELQDGNAQQIYFQVFSSAEDLSPEMLVEAARVAARDVVATSSLEEILGELARHHPDDETVSLALIEAMSRMSSPSPREDGLRMLAQRRKLTRQVAIAAIHSASEISSPSSKADALAAVLAAAPAERDIQTAYIEAAETISSPSQQEDALLELLKSSISDGAVFRQIAAAAAKLGSPSSQEDVMVKLIRAAPSDEKVLRACLDVVPSISSPSSQEDVMEEFLRRDGLGKSLLHRAAEVVKQISSTSMREELQARILDRLAESS